MNPVFFETPDDFRQWLSGSHLTERELWVGYYKVGSKKASITYSQSVDEALCFGWIDGLRKSIDKDSYCIRFTPRKAKSNWSAVNIHKAETLIKQGLMQSAGILAYQTRKEETSGVYSYENKPRKLPDEWEQRFKKDEKAWAFFASQSQSYQRTMIYWIMGAKQETTKLNRFERLLKACGSGSKIY
jgi:uncharacterized protein YdeI (YjbR/CyaY-like superfamily)